MVHIPLRQFLWFLIFLFGACPVVAQEVIEQASVEDSIAKRLETAKDVYVGEALAARDRLLAAIDSEIEKTENRSGMSVEVQLKKLKELSAAREAYVDAKEKLPSLGVLKSATRRCERQLAASKKNMEKAFETAADEYRKPPLKNFEAAAKTLADRKSFFEATIGELGKRGRAEFSPEFNAENWTVSDPKSVESKEGRLLIAAGSKGNIVLTQKDDFATPDAVVTLSAQAGTEAYLVLNARLKKGEWRGVTSPIQFENGKILAGGQSINFKPSNALPLRFDENEDFELHMKARGKTDNDKRLVVVSAVNSKQTARIYYSKTKTSEAGAVGFFVRKGAIAVKKFELTTTKK